ncbi:Crp/Fnr family transcriptional regulator [Paucibacter sp. XJ19-41]|uniref:Crp/Fnr family transcriptional regulator n=1 Tax=Paucibacter sp. XJ19-41 TaxID=2927824 RepID=UPI00234ADD0F|nr:Crp/Fnr family transcriptional regulator [Paucibacter sp. XJ19-41]MDC6170559.1 Crp/Fnr family transcriptional regulator [Paucibacter sp. XJ19-41]
MTTLTPAALQALRQLVGRHIEMRDPDLALLAEASHEKPFRKGETFLAAGEPARVCGLVIEGMHGEFYVLPNGSRKAKWLARPGDVFGSLEDLVREGPARSTIEALSDGRVLCVPYHRLRELALQQPLWAAFFVSLLESLYRQKSEREYSLLMLNAEDRYQWFLDHYGGLEGSVSLEIVASYLGISAVHLSRVRAARSRPAD